MMSSDRHPGEKQLIFHGMYRSLHALPRQECYCRTMDISWVLSPFERYNQQILRRDQRQLDIKRDAAMNRAIDILPDLMVVVSCHAFVEIGHGQGLIHREHVFTGHFEFRRPVVSNAGEQHGIRN